MNQSSDSLTTQLIAQKQNSAKKNEPNFRQCRHTAECSEIKNSAKKEALLIFFNAFTPRIFRSRGLNEDITTTNIYEFITFKSAKYTVEVAIRNAVFL